MDIDKQMTLLVLWKWITSEPLSLMDAERLIKVFETAEVRIDLPDQQVVAGLQVRLKSVLQAKYFGNAPAR